MINKYFDMLPYEIMINHIYPYISDDVLIWLNKDNYIKLHDNVLSKISKNDFNTYIRFIIKNDLSFVFQQVINTNLQISINNNIFKSKYYYKNNTFNNNYDFYNYYCIEYNSNKCRSIISDKLSSLYGKKQHKKLKIKNNIKNNKWIN